uniref:Uncharacterized protein n=1 Tax=Arundo donax TaxID=35708 RepID=A0A0A9ATI2_ARUDO
MLNFRKDAGGKTIERLVASSNRV